MSGYNYDHFIKCFAERTLKNYERISLIKNSGSVEVYEVTQLINSLFGLLIVPFEKFKFKKDNYTTKESFFETKIPDEYRRIKIFVEMLKKDKRLRSTYKDENFPVSSFIKHLRNALAHSGDKGLHFLPCNDSASCITSIIFYDSHKETNQHFCAELKINEIEELIKIISSMYQKAEKTNNMFSQNDYTKIEKKYRDILNGKSDKLFEWE